MPCNGVSITTAQVNIDLEEHFSHQEHRELFAAWLREQGVQVRQWWKTQGERMPAWALGIGSDWTGLAFRGNRIEISDEGEYRQYQEQVDSAYAYAQIYAGMLIQEQVIQTVMALGLEPRDLEQDAQTGALTFTINLAALTAA